MGTFLTVLILFDIVYTSCKSSRPSRAFIS